MRFDDSLKTVLSADASSPFGAQAAFRQIADLIARRRIEAAPDMIARLEALRPHVPVTVRAAAARALALADPPLALVASFAADLPDVSGAVLRAARLGIDDWCTLIPSLGPIGRSVLRRRDDLDAAVVRALESFGSTDFALGYAGEPIPVSAPPAPAIIQAPSGGFEIASIVDRLAAFQRDRDAAAGAPREQVPDDTSVDPVTNFSFETDATGVIRWIDAEPRAAIVGVGFASPGADGRPQVDGVAWGAFRRRTAFDDARLSVAGRSALAGDWRISGAPLFDPASGRFSGFRGQARRPRVDEGAVRAGAGVEGLRRLVHELRTPANAIAGFSELIERQLMGAVPDVYRQRAATIHHHATDLIAAIEDLEMAARIQGDALELRDGFVPVAPLMERAIEDLAALVRLRGCELQVGGITADLSFACDDRAVERLIGRLLAALVSIARVGEVVAIDVRHDGPTIALWITRPGALASVPDAGLLTLDAEREAELPGGPLLGTGFALRLATNLAQQLGGSLTIGANRLTLALPAGLIDCMGQASTNQ